MFSFWKKIFEGFGWKSHVSFQQFFGGFAPPEPNIQDQLRAYKGWVYACISAITEEVAAINLRVLQLNKGDLVEVDDHPLLDLLFKVNPFQSKTAFFQLHQTYKELTGESFWFLERGGNSPKPTDPIKEIWLLRPDLVDVIPDEQNFIKGYTYRTGGKMLTFLPHEIIHFKYPNPLDPFRGLSPVQAAALAVDTERFSSEWNRNFFFNSARPDAVIKTKNTLSDESWKRLKAEWEANYGGLKNSQRVALLEQGLEFETIQINQKDMDFFAQKQMTRDEIFAIWRVPKTVLGITEDVTVSNAEATNFIFSSRVIRPKMQDIVNTLNEFLTPMFGDDIILDFDDPTPENREKKINEFVQGHNRWLTINEIRDQEGLPSITGGDAIYQPLSFFPVGEPTEQRQERSFITLFGSPPLNIKKELHKKELKRKLLAGNERRKRIEQMRRKIELIVEEKKEAKKQEEEGHNKVEQAQLITDIVKVESERDFYKAQAEEKDETISQLENDKTEAEQLAADAAGLNDGEENVTTEKGN